MMPNELADNLDMQDLEKMVAEKSAELPNQWSEFDDNSKRRAIASLLRGGLTPFGFNSLKPNWLEQIRELGDQARTEIESIDKILNAPDEDIH